MASLNAQQSDASKVADPEDQTIALQKHLQEVIEGDSFKGSHRSAQFLRYIVEQTIAGHLDSLKERAIGAELFGRPPSYDTGQDAIVRVAASDVRKRLLQHYSTSGMASDIRIHLPQGSYIPEIVNQGPIENKKTDGDSGRAQAVSSDGEEANLPLARNEGASEDTAKDISEKPISNGGSRLRWQHFAASLLVVNLVVVGLLWSRFRQPTSAAASTLPWSALFRSSHPIRLITSDPAIVQIQAMTGSRISLSDYIGRRFESTNVEMPPEARQFLFKGDWTAPGDVQTALSIAELAQRNARSIIVQPASRTRISDLKTDDNFIFLGSPRTNPWVSLFNDSLDFQFLSVGPSQNEVIRVVNPKPGEQAIYTPAAGTVGESFAILAFVQNPVQEGQVLVVAGATGTGTDIAGKLITDLPRLATELQRCGIPPSGPLKHFEMLLRVNVMAGASSGFNVVACRNLPDNSVH